MVLADERILEYIQKEGSGTPTEMQDSGYVRYTKSHISRRCKVLAEHNLLQHLGNGVYIITEDGERYLAGELDTSESDDDGESEQPASA